MLNSTHFYDLVLIKIHNYCYTHLQEVINNDIISNKCNGRNSVNEICN